MRRPTTLLFYRRPCASRWLYLLHLLLHLKRKDFKESKESEFHFCVLGKAPSNAAAANGSPPLKGVGGAPLTVQLFKKTFWEDIQKVDIFIDKFD